MKAAITTDGKRIMARIDYANGHGPKLAKQVPGARADWDKTVTPNVFKGWVYPLSMETCRAFRRVFGDELTVMPVLAHWAQEEVGRERSLETLREEAIESVDLSRVAERAPKLYAALQTRRYQISGTGFILTGRDVILGDDPGLGKTLQGLAAVVQAGSNRILVACRRTATRTVWERETARWTPHIKTFVAQGSRTERMATMADFWMAGPGPKMLIINIEMIRAKRIETCPETNGDCRYKGRPPAGHPKHKIHAEPQWPFLTDNEWDAIILDESHNLLASTANVQSKRITQQRFGAMQLRKRLVDGGLAIAMSGTPFRSKVEKGWGTLNWLRPDVFSSYWRFAETHFGVEEGRWGKIVGGTGPDGKPVKVLEPRDPEAWDRMLRPYYLKRTKADAAPDLPPIQYAGTPIDPDDDESPRYVQIDMLPDQAKLYWQMEAEAEANLPEGRITATGVLAEITRLRQFANGSGSLAEGRRIIPALPSNKIEWLIEFMQERMDSGAKVVIASSFTEWVEFTADVLRDQLGLEVHTLTGATSDRDRARLVERFQDPEDKLSVVVINRDAGGESITLDAADEMVVLDLPWVSDRDEQLNARIHRVSRIHQVIVYRLVSVGTVDEWMASLTDEQRAVVAGASPRKLSELAIAGKAA